MNKKHRCPLISVIMPCFNAEKFLIEAIESVLGQTYTNVELIVVDDGSTDGSSKILEQYATRINLIHQANKGPMFARNQGIAKANGEFIAFLDSDDFWREDCLELLSDALIPSDAAIAYCGWQNSGPGDLVGPLYIPPDYEAQDKLEQFLAGCPWPIHAALTRRSAIIDVGKFSTHYEACEDYDLWLGIGGVRKILLVPEVLAFYRHHSVTQVSRKRWLAAYSMLKIKKDFINDNPEVVAHIGRQQLKDLLSRPFLEEGFKCYWKRDLNSARKIFRYAFFHGWWCMTNLKYILPCFLPFKLQNALLR